MQVHQSHLLSYPMSRKPSHSSSSRQLATDWSSDDGRSMYTDVSSVNSKAYDTGAYRAVSVTASQRQPPYGRSSQRAVSVERPEEVVHGLGPRSGTKQPSASNAAYVPVSNAGHFYAPPIATTSRDTSPAADRRDTSASHTPTSNAGRLYAAPTATTSGATRAPASNASRFFAAPTATSSRGIPTAGAESSNTNTVRMPASNAGHFYATPTYTSSGGTQTTAERRGANVVRTTAPDTGRFYAAPTAPGSGGTSTLAASERRLGDANAIRTPASNAVHTAASDAVRFYTSPTVTSSRVTPTVAAAECRDINTVRTPASDISRFYAVPTTTKGASTAAERTGRDTSPGHFYPSATGATPTASEPRDSKAGRTNASNAGRFYAASTAATYGSAPTATEWRDTSQLDAEPRRDYQIGQVSMHASTR
jgi:hypothetical protein